MSYKVKDLIAALNESDPDSEVTFEVKRNDDCYFFKLEDVWVEESDRIYVDAHNPTGNNIKVPLIGTGVVFGLECGKHNFYEEKEQA